MINLYTIYKKVHQRIGRARTDQEKGYAEKSADLARKILEKPTLKNVNNFRRSETKWRELGLQRKSMADDFERAIRSKNYTIERSYMLTYPNGYNPSYGLVYCVEFDDFDGVVKIGSTTQDLNRRLRQIKSKYDISSALMAHAIECQNPSQVEHLVHTRLKELRAPSPVGGNSSEWFLMDLDTANSEIIQASSDLSVEVNQFIVCMG